MHGSSAFLSIIVIFIHIYLALLCSRILEEIISDGIPQHLPSILRSRFEYSHTTWCISITDIYRGRSQVAGLVEDEGDRVLAVDSVLALVVHLAGFVPLDLAASCETLEEELILSGLHPEPLALLLSSTSGPLVEAAVEILPSSSRGSGIPLEDGLDLQVLEVL